jgi:hypothetical protein
MRPIGKLLLLAALVGVAACTLLGCFSTPSSAAGAAEEEQGSPAQQQPASTPAPGPSQEARLVERLKEYLDNGLGKLDQGAISEGIGQLVSVLAEAQSAGAKSAEAQQVVRRAETELTKIRNGLALEAGMEWLDQNKNQVNGSSVDVGSEKALSPSVILTFNFGAGKALVSGAPIFFEFVRGGGLLTSFVTTNDYGQANCSIARLENPSEESIIRASLVYRVKGYTYPFQDIIKDFVYVPPSRKATILVLERAGERVQQDPVILDSVYNRLKKMAFDFSQYNGILLGEEFLKVFGGDPAAIRRLGLEAEVSYLVMVLNDGYYVNQVELNGKKYDIYKSQTTATTRIIRVSDGKILYSGTVQAVSGQGGTEEKAVLDGFRSAAQAMAEKLEVDYGQIDAVLTGGGM